MSRVTIIHKGRSFRCSPQVARIYIERGAKLDRTDKRGSESFERFMRNRPLPKKSKAKTKTRDKE